MAVVTFTLPCSKVMTKCRDRSPRCHWLIICRYSCICLPVSASSLTSPTLSIDGLLPPVPVCGHHCSLWGGCDRTAARHWPNVAPLQQPLHAHEWRIGAAQGIIVNALGFLAFMTFRPFHFVTLHLCKREVHGLYLISVIYDHAHNNSSADYCITFNSNWYCVCAAQCCSKSALVYCNLATEALRC